MAKGCEFREEGKMTWGLLAVILAASALGGAALAYMNRIRA